MVKSIAKCKNSKNSIRITYFSYLYHLARKIARKNRKKFEISIYDRCIENEIFRAFLKSKHKEIYFILEENQLNYHSKLINPSYNISPFQKYQIFYRHHHFRLDKIKKFLLNNFISYAFNCLSKFTNNQDIYSVTIKKETFHDLNKINNCRIGDFLKMKCILRWEFPNKQQTHISYNKEFREIFNEYRRSEQFWEDAMKTCENDFRIGKIYIELAKKFINFIKHKEKVYLYLIRNDDGLSGKFILKSKYFLKSLQRRKESKQDVTCKSDEVSNRLESKYSISDLVNDNVYDFQPNSLNENFFYFFLNE